MNKIGDIQKLHNAKMGDFFRPPPLPSWSFSIYLWVLFVSQFMPLPSPMDVLSLHNFWIATYNRKCVIDVFLKYVYLLYRPICYECTILSKKILILNISMVRHYCRYSSLNFISLFSLPLCYIRKCLQSFKNIHCI